MTIILIIRLILVIFDADEIAMDGFGVEGESYEGIDSCGFGNEFESPRLFCFLILS